MTISTNYDDVSVAAHTIYYYWIKAPIFVVRVHLVLAHRDIDLDLQISDGVLFGGTFTDKVRVTWNSTAYANAILFG